MSLNQFEALASIIQSRRTIKAAQMNGVAIPQQDIQDILALADWAPTHGRTEPWRFEIFHKEHFNDFCLAHAEMYKKSVDETAFSIDRYNLLLQPAATASHLIVVYMKRTPATKIPVMEEEAATAAAIQNLLLGATAKGIASIWNTGGMFFSEAMHQYFNLEADDRLMGFIYLGYTDQEAKEGTRKIPLDQKVTWR